MQIMQNPVLKDTHMKNVQTLVDKINGAEAVLLGAAAG